MTDRVLREATPGDASALRDIYAAPIVNHQLGFEPDETSPAVDDLIRGDELLVVEQEGVVAAAINARRLTHRMAHVVEISAVGVSPQHQGQGIGRWMIEQLLRRLASEGVRRVQLTVAQDNKRGVAFWRAMGFEVEGTLRGYFRRAGETSDQDELAMARSLPG
jgi:putative acetyltransferase